MKIHGELDTALQCLKRSTEYMENIFKEGTTRLRKGDIVRARVRLKELEGLCVRSRKVLREFETIAKPEKLRGKSVLVVIGNDDRIESLLFNRTDTNVNKN